MTVEGINDADRGVKWEFTKSVSGLYLNRKTWLLLDLLPSSASFLSL